MVIFRQSSDPFRLLSGGESTGYKVEITDAFLRVPMLEMSNAIMVSHNDASSICLAYYPYTESDIKSFVISEGSAGTNLDNLYLGNIPSSIVVASVKQTGFYRAYTSNPFNFEHFNLSYMAFMISRNTYPAKGFSVILKMTNILRDCLHYIQ